MEDITDGRYRRYGRYYWCRLYPHKKSLGEYHDLHV